MNLLFTSVGRRVELIRGFRRATCKMGAEVQLMATDIDELAPAIQEVDKYFLVPRFTDHDYVPSLLGICRNEQIDVVFPLIDPDIPILADNRSEFENIGTKLAVVSSDAAEISADKWSAFQFFRQLGLHTPNSWLPGDLDPSEHDYPRFIKPRRGSAANDTFRVNNADELKFFANYVSDPIIQEFISGPEITTDIICDFGGNVKALVSRQRIAVRGGEVVKGFTIDDKDVRDGCQKIASTLPAVGPITAQCMMKNGVPHFIEINARLGGGIPLAIAAGVDVPELLIRMVRGDAVQPLQEPGYQIGLHMTRFDDSFFLTKEKVVETSHHL